METITYGLEGSGRRKLTRLTLLFFMVEIFRLNFKSQPCLNTEKVGEDNNNTLTIGKSNDNVGNKNYPEPKQKYVKILVKDPFNNRDLILKVTKKQKGVISIIYLKLSLLILSIVFTLYLAVTSLLFIGFFCPKEGYTHTTLDAKSSICSNSIISL